MSMLSPSRDPEKLKGQILVFDQKAKELKKVNDEWLRGRNIDQLELQAKTAIANAKLEVKAIVDKAQKGVEGVERAKGEYEELKQKIADSARQAEQSKQEAARLKAEVERMRSDAVAAQSALDSERIVIETRKAYLQDQTAKLKALLSTFNASIN